MHFYFLKFYNCCICYLLQNDIFVFTAKTTFYRYILQPINQTSNITKNLLAECGAGNAYPSGTPDFTSDCHLCLLISCNCLVFWVL